MVPHGMLQQGCDMYKNRAVLASIENQVHARRKDPRHACCMRCCLQEYVYSRVFVDIVDS